jgi:hypothetical protein
MTRLVLVPPSFVWSDLFLLYEPDTLKCIAMLAGPAVSDLVMKQPNGIGNVMNMETNAHTAYDNLKWGIEAHNDNGMV